MSIKEKRETYLASARQAESFAKEAKHESAKQYWFKIADDYRKLAWALNGSLVSEIAESITRPLAPISQDDISSSDAASTD